MMMRGILSICLFVGSLTVGEVCVEVNKALNGYSQSDYTCQYEYDASRNDMVLKIVGKVSPQAKLNQIPQSVGNIYILEIHSMLNDISPDALENFKVLEALELFNNAIKRLPEKMFSSLSSLTRLQMDNNGIEFAVPFSKLPRRLVNANFGNNQIKWLIEINKLPNTLSDLFLHNNRLTSFIMDPSDQPNYSLKSLSLQGNRIKEYYTPGLSKLEFLYLDRNLLTEVSSDMLQGLVKLAHLTLSNNRIEVIAQDAFLHTPALQTLDLDRNVIRTLGENISFPNLYSLDLSLNRLQYLHLKVFFQLTNLKLIRFYGNPFDCGCLEDLLKWMKNYNIGIHCKEYSFSGKAPACIVYSGNIHYCAFQNYVNDSLYSLENEFIKTVSPLWPNSNTCLHLDGSPYDS